MITKVKKLDNGVILLGDNLIELKMIGAIFVEDILKYYDVEIQLKNGRYKHIAICYEGYELFKEAWLEELDRRNKETARCNTPKERVPLSDTLKEHITILFNELKEELKSLR